MGLQLRFMTSDAHPAMILAAALAWLLVVTGLTVGGLMAMLGYLVAKDGYRFASLALFSLGLLIAVGGVSAAALFLLS